MSRLFKVSAFLLAAALAMVACGDFESPAVSLPPPPPSGVDADAVSGTYAVHGITVQAMTGRQREIAGEMTLAVDGVRYEVSFDLGTTAPDVEEPTPVRVRGTGRGFIVGGTFTGTTEEWMALDGPMHASGSVPLPVNAGRRIVSSSQASFGADGLFQILLQNYAPEGERYDPSVTVLAGRRVGPTGTP